MVDANEHVRFNKWLKIFEQSFQNASSKEELVAFIKASIEKESQAFPHFLAQYAEALEDQTSSSYSLQEHLSRINYPKLSILYNNIKEELQSIKAEGELLYGVKTEFAENEYEQNFEGLFEELNHSAKDPLIGFCKLADLCFRLDRAKNIDNKRLDRFEQKERMRKLRNEVSLKTAEERTPYLLGNDESGLISKSSLAMSEEVHQLKSAVEEAQREEEEALRIYEAAKRKTRLAESSLNEVETSIDMLQTQVSLLKQVNEVKLQLSKYNSESAELRLQLLSNLRQTISKAQDELDNGHLSQELPDLLNYLLHTLQNMFNISSNKNEDSSNDFSSEDNNSKQLAFFHSIRVCYEALKLFKKLTINTSYHKFAPMVQGLETSLKQLLSKNLSTPTLMLQSKSTNIPKYKNATVVLYFTHLFHDTPSDHVEDQKRVETCLRVLMRLKLPSASNDTVRALTFEKCDHIKSPPFWCLSLVHSSHYLKRLYEYEKEAKRDDLYVPLEFDTEWESQYELSSDSEPEEIKRKAQNLFNFQPSKHWKQRLGDESMDHLLQILAPRDGDFTIANALTRKGKRIRSHRVRRRQSDVVVPEAVDQHKSETRASTPYGEGTVLELNQQTGFAKIRLVWGATAYLNSDSFKLIGQAVDQKIKKLATTPATPSSSSQQLIRFSHTDLRLHKLLTRILTHVRIQRHILEKVDVKDAHMSLWLHGRTSAGLSKNIEQASYRWLFNFRYQDLDAYIKRHDELAPVDFETNNNYECPTFMKDLLTIKLPSPLPTSTTPDEYFGSLEFNQEELKKDAFEYSARRLTNKSGLPRAKGSRNRRKKEEILAAQKESTETRRRSTGSKKRKFYDREMKPLDSDEEDDGERQEDGGNKEEREGMTEQVAERTEMTEELNEDNDNEKEQIGGDDQMTLASDNEIDVSVAKGENQPKEENTQQSADLALDFQPYELGAYHASTDKDRRFLPRKDGFWRLPALPDTRRGKIRKEINAGYFTDATDLQKFEELLQKLLVILMKRMNLKQITVAHELEKCFRSKHTQTGVSGWFHNRSSFELSTKLVMQSFLFIFTHQKYLQEKELSKFNDLLKHPYFQFILKGTKFVKLSEMTEEDEDELGLKRSSKSHQKDYDNDNNNSGQIQSNIIQVKVEDSTISSASPVATPQSSKLPVQHRLLEEFLVPPNLISPRSSIQIKIESTMDSTKSSEESVTHTEDAKTTIPPEESVKSSINPVVESEEMKDTEDIKSVKSDGSSIVEEAKANNKAGDEEMSVDSMEETENLPPVPESVVREIKIKNQEADLSEIEEVPQPRFKGRGRPGRKKKNIEYRMLPENERNHIENQDNNDDEPESPRDHTLKAKYSDKFYMQEFDEEKPISLKTIAMILNDFIDEVDRRELSHSYVAKEASRLSLSLLSQPIISKFIRLRSNPYLSRGDEFSYQVIKWLLYSQKKGANYANEERANCSHCGIYRNAFVTKTDFLTHLGICSTLQDRIKPMSKWKAFLEEESLKIDECLEKMLSGEMVISVSNHDTTSKTLVIKEETAMEIGETVEDTSAEEKEIQTTSIPDLVSASIDAIPSLVQCNHCSRLVSSKNSIKCRTCPSLIHARCGVPDDNNNLYCQDCTLLGLSDGVESSTTVSPGQWVYVYTNANTAWRKAVVLYLDPSRPHIVLVKFIPAIDDADSYLWIDITKRNIYDISTAPIEEDDEDEEDDDEEEPGPKRKRRRRLSSDVLAKRESDKILKNRDRNEDDDDDLESEEEVPVRKRRGRKPRATTAENDSSATTTNQAPTNSAVSDGMTDTYVSANSLKAALCAAGTVCKGIDIVMSGENTNAFACTRPPGHHCGRNGCTKGSISTGFCLLNNAAIALTYARVFWGVTKIAIVDIDVHFGNGTAEIVQNDPDTFFASVQMIYGPKNDGNYFPLAAKNCGCGFYPSFQGVTEVKENYVSVGIFPANMVYALECAPSKSTPTAANIGEKKAFHAKESDDIMSEEEKNDANTDDKSEIMSVDDENIPTDNSKAIIEEIEPEENHTAQGETLPFCSGSEGYITAIRDIVIPRLKQFQPELLIISAGFDGYFTDPLGSELKLSTKDFHRCTKLLMESMEQIAISQGKTSAKVLSILEGGYDTAPDTLGLAKCVEAHVKALMGV